MRVPASVCGVCDGDEEEEDGDGGDNDDCSGRGDRVVVLLVVVVAVVVGVVLPRVSGIGPSLPAPPLWVRQVMM